MNILQINRLNLAFAFNVQNQLFKQSSLHTSFLTHEMLIKIASTLFLVQTCESCSGLRFAKLNFTIILGEIVPLNKR